MVIHVEQRRENLYHLTVITLPLVMEILQLHPHLLHLNGKHLLSMGSDARAYCNNKFF